MSVRKGNGRRKIELKKGEIELKEKLLKDKQLTFTVVGFISVMIALFWITYNATSWKSEVEHKFSIIKTEYSNQKSDVCKLKTDNTSAKINFMELNTKLANIETLLIEIKADMKEKK